MASDTHATEAAITAARLKQEQTESDCEFRLTIASQGKQAVETELGSVRGQMHVSRFRQKFTPEDAINPTPARFTGV
jgi:hypothetical protein